MKKFVLRLLGFLHNFGLIKGSVLMLKTELGFISSLKLPNIRHPISLRKKTSDLATFLQVFVDREYKINFNNPKVVFDCGSNIGLFAIHIKNEFPDATVICVEPDPENFMQVKKNLAAYTNIYFENCGVWNKDTKLKVYDKYNVGKWGIIVEEDEINGTVPAISISSLMKKYGVGYIDVLKMDIEASEKQVFQDNYQDWLPKVKTLVIEFHDFMVPNCARVCFEAINNSMKNYELKSKGENTIIVNNDLA